MFLSRRRAPNQKGPPSGFGGRASEEPAPLALDGAREGKSPRRSPVVRPGALQRLILGGGSHSMA
eukprot:12112927-Alexandrium_andersonii.AAC.1